MDKGLEKKNFCISWWLIFIAMGCILLPSLILSGRISEERYYLFSFLGEATILIPILAGYVNLLGKTDLKELGFNRFHAWMLPFVIILPITAQPFINLFTFPVVSLLNFLFGTSDTAVIVPNGWSEYIFAVLTVCVAAPVLEEILCRAIVMHYLKDYGLLVCLFTSSLAFTLLHFDPSTFLVVFFLGMLLGVIRIASNSVWASIIAHSANNAAAFFMSLNPKLTEMVDIPQIIISVILFPLLLYLFLKLLPSADRRNMQYKPIKSIGVSAAQIICVAVYGFYAFILLISNIFEAFTHVPYMM